MPKPYRGWRFAAAVSPLALAIATTPAMAAATQPVPPPSNTAANPQATDQPAAGPAIVITGFRAALRSATAKKKNSELIIESVNAEDVGKLPDNGIGESIARLPGL